MPIALGFFFFAMLGEGGLERVKSDVKAASGFRIRWVGSISELIRKIFLKDKLISRHVYLY